MVSLEKSVRAKMEVYGKTFEVLVDPNLATKLRSGKDVDFSDLLVVDKIFSDASKGLTAAKDDLIKAFGTDEINKVAEKIILKGRLQVTTEQRRKLVEEKRKQLIQVIARNAINPQNKLPHPPARIENALNEIHFTVDPFKSVEEQVTIAIESLNKILPISFEKIKIELILPVNFASRVYSNLKSYSIISESWLNDGSLKAVIELPAGLKNEFFNKLNSLTHGDFVSKVL